MIVNPMHQYAWICHGYEGVKNSSTYFNNRATARFARCGIWKKTVGPVKSVAQHFFTSIKV